jgi:PIN domain nuclease of toxin-antitoxin system
MLLLDTHTWVWSVEGDVKRIGRRARRRLEEAAARNQIRVSPASIFEVAALCLAGRLRVAQSAEQWINDAMTAPGLRVAELTVATAIDAGQIPRTALADPLDRLLVATARRLDATFLTADGQILAYAAETGSVRVADASA